MNKTIIALGIICVILAASLVGVIAVTSPSGNSDLQAQLTAKDNQISDLQAQIANLTASQQQTNNEGNITNYVLEVAYLNQQLLSMNDTITSLTSDNAGYNQVLNLQLSGSLYDGTFTQDANTSTTLTLTTDQLLYAGYVTVAVQATASTTYAEIQYSFGGTSFDYNQTVGTSGTATFAVLPGTVQIIIGNTNQTSTNSVTATATYYY